MTCNAALSSMSDDLSIFVALIKVLQGEAGDGVGETLEVICHL
jgi:hypothetical protein